MIYQFRTASGRNMCGNSDFNLLGFRLSGSQGLNPRQFWVECGQ